MASSLAALAFLASSSFFHAGSLVGDPAADSSPVGTVKLPDYEIAELRDRLTALAIYIATTFEIELDYSPESVRDVEKMLAELHAEYRRTGNFDGFDGIALEFGAYIVTVIERNYEPGEWKRNHPEFGVDSFPYYWRGSVIFPYVWCKKRLIEGPEDNVWAKFSALVLDEVEEQ